jgi:TolB-like protein/AraC-like DNA-binding protein/Tfp pilus assembly protein PilF
MTTAIAVLPFVNMSSDPKQEYFADGITEEIITALSRIEELKVTSRSSSFFFKDKALPLKEIAQQLGVDVILEGSIRLAMNNVRITAQLIQAQDDFHFWSETWDRQLKNIFEIQDEISLLIAEKLREQFGHFEIQEHLVETQTQNLDAYALSLRAKEHFNRWNPVDVKKAIDLWKRALKLDPNHDESMVGLADAYGFLGVTQSMDFMEAWDKVTDYTERALKINADNAGAYYQLANRAFFVECDFREAYKQALKAIELMPNYPEAQQFMAFLYMLEGSMEEAGNHLGKALMINPLSEETLFYKAYYQYRTGDYTGALDQLNSLLERNPHNIPAYVTKSYVLLKLERTKEVRAFIDSIDPEVMVETDQKGVLCLAHLLEGNAAKGEKLLAELLEEAQNPMAIQAHMYVFIAYGALGRADAAFDWFEKVVKLKSSVLMLGFSDPLVEPIKSDTRYTAFAKELYNREEIKPQSEVKSALLEPKAVEELSARLKTFMDEEEPFLDPSLSLRSLAGRLDIHPNKLSWLLNDSFGKNFNNFVNHYRVERFKSLATDPDNSHISLIGLAYESGFNSKTVFNTYFKKETGQTPKAYLDSRK